MLMNSVVCLLKDLFVDGVKIVFSEADYHSLVKWLAGDVLSGTKKRFKEPK